MVGNIYAIDRSLTLEPIIIGGSLTFQKMCLYLGPMTTKQATATIAAVYEALYVSGRPYAETERNDAIARALDVARAHGRAWEWRATAKALARAYAACEAVPPDADGYSWHCGCHPIQTALRKGTEQ